MQSLIFLSCLFFSIYSFSLSEREVLTSSLKTFPKIQEFQQSVKYSEGVLLESKGLFDFKLSSGFQSYTEGYYDGRYSNVRIEKPIGYFGATAYGGYRKSSGLIPDYEFGNLTTDGGESFVGLSLSVLKNNFIDEKRLKLNLAGLGLNLEKANFLDQQLKVQSGALKAYWKWVVAGYKYKAYKEVLELAEVRAKNIKRRIISGDLARIYQVENMQYILKRRSAVLLVENGFKNAANNLSLFYRDLNGVPIVLDSIDELPIINPASLGEAFLKEEDNASLFENNPKYRSLRFKREMKNQKLKFAKSRFLPKLDLKIEQSVPRGDGLSSVEEDESKLMLNFSMPFEFRKERGKQKQALAELRAVELQLALFTDTIKANFLNTKNRLEALNQVFKMSWQEVSLAKELVRSEKIKFKKGASDLLMLNLREEALVKSQISSLEALFSFKAEYANYLMLSSRLLVN